MTPLTRQVEDLEQLNAVTNTYQQKKQEQTIQALKEGMHTGNIPSIEADSGATTHCGKTSDPFIYIGQRATKILQRPFRQTAQSTQEAKQHHEVSDLAQMVHIIPGLQHSSLLGISKFVDANYITIFTPQ